MRTHIAIVAWVNIISGSLLVLMGLGMFFMCFVLGMFALPELPFIGGLGAGVLLLFALFSLPSLLTGWGLLQFAPWARTGAIVLAILELVFHPFVGFGTLLGIYSLIVLFHPETRALFGSGGRLVT